MGRHSRRNNGITSGLDGMGLIKTGMMAGSALYGVKMLSDGMNRKNQNQDQGQNQMQNGFGGGMGGGFIQQIPGLLQGSQGQGQQWGQNMNQQPQFQNWGQYPPMNPQYSQIQGAPQYGNPQQYPQVQYGGYQQQPVYSPSPEAQQPPQYASNGDASGKQ